MNKTLHTFRKSDCEGTWLISKTGIGSVQQQHYNGDPNYGYHVPRTLRKRLADIRLHQS